MGTVSLARAAVAAPSSTRLAGTDRYAAAAAVLANFHASLDRGTSGGRPRRRRD